MGKYRTEIKVVDNSAQVLAQLKGNKKVALTAMGIKAVGLTIRKMQNGYGKPIYKTGDLQRSISSAVNNSHKDTVDVGSGIEYAPLVHEGTSRMAGRPFLRDALNEGSEALQNIAAAYLKQGF